MYVAILHILYVFQLFLIFSQLLFLRVIIVYVKAYVLLIQSQREYWENNVGDAFPIWSISPFILVRPACLPVLKTF